MPPKRGQKRKPTVSSTDDAVNGHHVALGPPDKSTWQGWVEMESEPAFFNVMLKEMGVKGVRVEEVLEIEDDVLATLPQPVHALIFLFRFQSQDEQDQYTGTPQDHIWFANQVPDFACATIATLNIVNNIPGLRMGNELRDFKDFTKHMDPVTRGEMIDDFAFVKRIHNSFARENDILTADVLAQQKFARAKKKAATEKAQATKAAKKAAGLVAKEEALSVAKEEAFGVPGTGRRSGRATALTANRTEPPSAKDETLTSVDVHSKESTPELEAADGDFKLSGRGMPRAKLNLTASRETPDPDEKAPPPRRSGRARKPRNRDMYVSDVEEETPQEGFHFIAYMPIQDHVWKMDGLDYHPHDMGAFGLGGNGADGGSGNWMHVVAPALQNRMEAAQQQGEISFTLLAVVHDPAIDDWKDLCRNVKSLVAIHQRLDILYDDWRALEGGETPKDTLLGPSHEYDILALDLENTDVPEDVRARVERDEDFIALLEFRKPFLTRQTQIRSSLRSAKMVEGDDEEKARHRRHDYGAFVRRWMTALAELEVLDDIVG